MSNPDLKDQRFPADIWKNSAQALKLSGAGISHDEVAEVALVILKQKVRKLASEGRSLTSLGVEYGIERSRVSRWCTGIPKPVEHRGKKSKLNWIGNIKIGVC